MTSLKDLEEKLTQLDQEALADNAQFDVVLRCISEPLEWLNDSSTALVSHAAWKRHVWSVFKELVPRWTFALSSSSYRPYLDSTLTIKQSTNVAFQMAKVSLPILIECLYIQQDQASLDTLEMYASFLKYLALDTHVFKLYAQHTQKTDVAFFSKLLCSIPGHLANVFGIQLNQVLFNPQHEWYIDRNFYAKISKRLAENLDSKSVLFSQELVAKIIRQGHEDILIQSIYPMAKSSPGHWSSVFEPSFDQVTKTILYHVKQQVVSPNHSIKKASKELALILFDKLTVTKQLRIEDFLNTALLKLSKTSWADDTLARLAITAAIHAQGFENMDTLVIKFLKRVIGTWADPTFVKHASSRERTYVTMVVLCLVAYIPKQEIQYIIMAQTNLVQGVTTYFDSGDIPTAQLGAVIAEAISAKTDPDKPVDTGLIMNEELRKMKGLANITDALLENDDSDDKEEEKLSEQASDDDSEEDEEEEELDPDAIYRPEDDDENEVEEDSDDEFQAYQMGEESDDEGLKKESTSKSKTANKKPVFVRDLIRYLKDNSDPFKLEIGLNAAEQVIRQKTGSGTELSESSIELARYLISFPETFEIDNFRSLQQNALIALIDAVPETVTGSIIDELYDRNTSAGQKQLILAAISLAVRELSGWSTTTTTVAMDNAGRIKEEEKSDHLIEETTKQLENSSLTTAVGKTVFMSKRMGLEKQQKENIKRNRLSGLAGPVFFFPLLVGWWEGAQGRIKYWIGNNEVLSERFIMTLNIILHSSTNIPDKRKIVKEYFEFVSSMKYASHNSFGIKKALLLGIDCIVNTNYKGQEAKLFNDYTRELEETKIWLEEIMENNPEPKLQEVAIGILVKLSHIAMTAYGAAVH